MLKLALFYISHTLRTGILNFLLPPARRSAPRGWHFVLIPPGSLFTGYISQFFSRQLINFLWKGARARLPPLSPGADHERKIRAAGLLGQRFLKENSKRRTRIDTWPIRVSRVSFFFIFLGMFYVTCFSHRIENIGKHVQFGVLNTIFRYLNTKGFCFLGNFGLFLHLLNPCVSLTIRS